MDRTKHLKCADEALRRAENLAGEAEDYARGQDYQHRVAPYTAAGALWADIARTHTAIAAELPEKAAETEPTNG
ncbi:hypothetical protein [Streptomyces sp. NPDC002611]